MDLPIIIEVIEREKNIQSILPELDRMIGGGLVTLERARVILYRPARGSDTKRWVKRVEGLTPEHGEEEGVSDPEEPA